MRNSPILRRLLALAVAALGVFFVLSCQGWGMMLIRFIGYERALGESSVRRLDDGQVLLSNWVGMFLWSLPFATLGVYLVIVAVRIWRPRHAT